MTPPDSTPARPRRQNRGVPYSFALISKDNLAEWVASSSRKIGNLQALSTTYTEPAAVLLSCIGWSASWTSRPMSMLTPFQRRAVDHPLTNATHLTCVSAARNVQPNCTDHVAKPYVCRAISLCDDSRSLILPGWNTGSKFASIRYGLKFEPLKNVDQITRP